MDMKGSLYRMFVGNLSYNYWDHNKKSYFFRRSIVRGILPVIFLTAALFLFTPVCFAANITLSWDSNNDADYYVVYWREKNNPSNVKNSDNIDKAVLQYQVTNLDESVVYEFAVKAFNLCGNSSDYSDWIQGTPTADLNQATATTQELLNLVLNPTSDTTTSSHAIGPVDSNQTTATTQELLNLTLNPISDTTTSSERNGVNDNNQNIVQYPITTESPGEKNTDNFIPPTQTNYVENLAGNPTIEVCDNQLHHLQWLKSGWADYNALNGESRIATGDLNGDGKEEVIIGFGAVSSNPSIPAGFFEVLDDTYKHLAWGRIEWADYNEINGETWPACGDIDGDGKDEIVVGLGKNGKGYAEVFGLIDGQITHKSWLRIQWPDYDDLNGESRPICADINGDGIDEVIMGLGSKGGGKFEVFGYNSGNGSHLLWGFVDWPEYSDMNGETWPTAGDVDKDGHKELIVGLGPGGEGQMAVFKYEDKQELQWDWVQISWPEYNDVSGETRPVCGDVNNDGKDEVILGWETKSGASTGSNYYKVLSYNTTNQDWENYKDSKSSSADINSLPVKGAVNRTENIIVGIGSLKNSTTNPENTSAVSAIAGAGGSGSSCFIDSIFL